MESAETGSSGEASSSPKASPSGPHPNGIEWIRERLRESWCGRTSSLWSESRPSRGQCGVTALVLQDHLGGEILKTPVGRSWHFYNRIGDQVLDLTADQFRDPIVYLDLASSREEALGDTGEGQYRELARRFAQAVAEVQE